MNANELQILRSIISLDQLLNIDSLLSTNKDPLDYLLVKKWKESCNENNISINQNELILAAIDQELKTLGVESIFDEEGSRIFSYCNTGDEFGLTVMYYWPKEKFIVSSFCNIIEAIKEDMLEMFIND